MLKEVYLHIIIHWRDPLIPEHLSEQFIKESINKVSIL